MASAVCLQVVGQVSATAAQLTPKEVAELPNFAEVAAAEIETFDAFFQTLDNSPLTGPERALLHTYLWWKTHPDSKPQPTA